MVLGVWPRQISVVRLLWSTGQSRLVSLWLCTVIISRNTRVYNNAPRSAREKAMDTPWWGRGNKKLLFTILDDGTLLSGTDRGNALTERPQSSLPPTGFNLFIIFFFFFSVFFSASDYWATPGSGQCAYFHIVLTVEKRVRSPAASPRRRLFFF